MESLTGAPLGVKDEVDVGAAVRQALIDETLRELDVELIGLKPVKLRIRQIAALLLVERLREQASLSAEPPSLHMCFTGNPGPAKPPWRCAWRRFFIAWGTCGAGTWWSLPAMIWSGSTSGIRRRRRKRFCSGQSAECCSSTKRTTCIGLRTSATMDRKLLKSCFSSWKTGVT